MITPHQAIQYCQEAADTHDFRVAEVEGIVRHHEGAQVVAFRATEAGRFVTGAGFVDVLRDLRFYPWYDKRVGWSHAGFLKGARGAVDKGLFGFLTRDKPVALVGHSMGGAIAINAAAMLASMGFTVNQVITFGCPRSFRRGALRRYYKHGIITDQYSNRGDPVPDVPLRWWGYRHINEIVTSRPAVLRLPFTAYNHKLIHYTEALT